LISRIDSGGGFLNPSGGEQALRDLSQVMREVLNEESWRLAVTALK